MQGLHHSSFRNHSTVAKFKPSAARFGIGCLLISLFGAWHAAGAPPEKAPNAQASASAHWSDFKPSVGQADGFAETPELIKLGSGQPVVAPEGDGAAKMIPVRYFRRSTNAKGALATRDPVIQTTSTALNTPSPTTSFEGTYNIDGYIPPDTVGAIGPSNYVQAVNVRVQVFNRFTGAAQTTANPISTLFSSIGGLCASTDDGDPIVLYDQYADRWLIAQFANASSSTGPYYMSIAVSKTSDPTGAYYAYCFQTPGNVFPDYPKISVWPDGYYMSVNQFDLTANTYAGAGVYAFDRAKMLAGDPNAQYIYFNLNNTDPSIFGLLPSSVDGPPPPIGTPNYFVYLRGTSLGDASNDLRIFQFHADFANTNLATFTERADSPMAVASYSAFTAGVPQSGTTTLLDTLADRLMFRLQYRNFGTNESLVVTHTATGGSGQAAIRYYQLRRTLPGGTFAINEQATYAPDALHRWMGSAAMNYRGDLAVGYSVSSSSTYPSIRYAARLSTDPANGLYQGEATMITGTGSQTDSAARWGDYSALTLDPTDDCTFWYTQEYVATTGARNWRTRIGSFSLPGCSASPRATIQGTVSRIGSGLLLSNAVVRSTNGYFRITGTNGAYSMTVTPGTYDLSAGVAGIGTNTVIFTVTNGESRVQNFVLGTYAPDVRMNSYSLSAESCGNGAIDPGEIVTLNLGLKNVGLGNATNLVVTLQSSSSITSPSAPQTYGLLSTNQTPVSRSFTFVPVGACGSTIAPAFQIQDGSSNLGTITLTLPLGLVTNTFSENFDAVTRPAIPLGWSTIGSGAEPAWYTTNGLYDTAPLSAFSLDAASTGVNELDTPSIAISAGTWQLTFRHYYNLEASGTSTVVGYDGGVLEMKIGGGAWTDILAAGGTFVTNGYNRTISSTYSNPLAGRSAWSGNSGGFITTIVNLPAAASGQNVQFRWRCGTDTSAAAVGWYLDTVKVTATVCCPGPTTPLITSAGVSNNQFRLSMLGTPGSNYIIQANTNLTGTNWVPVRTNPAPFSFTDTNVNQNPQRFYRAIPKP